jgi:four helix bundle protein
MNNNNISIQERTKNFAIRVVNAYVELNKRNYNDAAYVLSKQFLRSGTSIGANCAEAEFAQSTKDFLSKYTIALKEAGETRYWIELLIKSNVVSSQKFEPMLQELNQIISILISTTKTIKEKVD